MTKISIDQIEATLRDQKIPGPQITKIITELENAAADEKADRGSAPKSKHQFVIVSTVEAPDLGYVLQMEEAAAPQAITERIVAAANSFNNSKRGRKVPVSTIGETLQNVGAKWFKHERPAGEVTRVKTKVAVARITIPNALPQ